jgi:hypothetical protein
MVAAIHHGECESQAEPEREDERLHPVRFRRHLKLDISVRRHPGPSFALRHGDLDF